jgi:hypothetical protein
MTFVYALLLYGASIVVAGAALYTGYLGFKFYIDEVVRK